MGCASSARYRKEEYETDSDELGYEKKYTYSLLAADEKQLQPSKYSVADPEELATVITEIPLHGSDELLLAICRADQDDVAKTYVHYESYIYEGSFITDARMLEQFREPSALRVVPDLEDDGRLEIQLKGGSHEDRIGFPIELLTTCSVSEQVIFGFFILPGFDLCQAMGSENTKKMCALESKLSSMEEQYQSVMDDISASEREMKRLKLDAEVLTHQVAVTKTMLQKENQKFNSRTHILDEIYNEKGAKAFQHHPAAALHRPRTAPIRNDFLSAMQLLGSGEEETECNLSECLKFIDEWEFDIFKFDEATGGASLLYLGIGLCYYYGIPQKFNIQEKVLVNFWQCIHAGYHANQYHNQMHAADVLQITHFLMKNGLTEQLGLTATDHFAAIIAAAAHDYDHPGLNNNFHSKTRAYLSTLYSDRSLLENHHAASLFENMRHEECDVFSTFSSDSRKVMRDLIVEMILSTDMGNHAKIVSTFKRRLHDTSVPLLRRDDLRLCLSMVLKTADISNCCRPLNLYTQWADRIANEFYSQGDAEKMLGNPISPFMDKRKHVTDFPNGQVSFINYIVSPLFELMIDFLPRLNFTTELYASNRAYWKDVRKS